MLLPLLALGLLVYVLFLVGWIVHRLTRPPRRTFGSALAQGRPGDPSRLPPGPMGPRAWKEWSFAWKGLKLPVWEVAGDVPEGATLVLSHGWGDSRIGALTRAVWLLPHCARVIAWDMPGHGEAPGTCALGAKEPDALRALLEHLREEAGIERVVLCGWSLGAGVSIACGTSSCIGIIAEAPYRLPITPARSVMKTFGLPHGMLLTLAQRLIGIEVGMGPGFPTSPVFDRARLARDVRVPMLILHGDQDHICPLQDARDIASAAPDARLVVIAGGGHFGLWTEPAQSEECAKAVAGFLASLR